MNRQNVNDAPSGSGRVMSALAAALLGLLLGACATAVPQATIDDYYERCVGSGDGATMQASYCGVVIDSGKLDNERLHRAYERRGRINEARGRATEAERDLRFAAELRGERYVGRDPGPARAQPPVQAPVPPREYRLVFNGFQCPRVQGDSILYPANEIFANVVVTDERGGKRVSKLPPRGVFNKVVAGSRRGGNNQIVWSGPSQPLILQIVVWEHDDGGPLVEDLTEVAVDFALTRGRNTLTRTMVKGSVARGVTNHAVRQASETLDLTGELSKHVSTLPKRILGTGNDLIGAIGINNILPEAYGETNRDGHFSYHVATRHRRGGADCRFYFQFR